MRIWRNPTLGDNHASPMVLIDISYFGHRAKHTTGDLSYNGIPTGTIYGVIEQLKTIRRVFDNPSTCFVLAWDSQTSIRKQMLPQYKVKPKKELTKEEEEEQQNFFYQMEILPTILEKIGFRHNIKHDGFEADDIIASICQWNAGKHPVYIVSSDHDLFQLLSYGPMYRPNKGKNYTAEHLWEDFHVTPEQWPMVQAIAGCSTDGVTGVFGIGEKTAANYVSGHKKVGPKKLESIKRASRLIKRNLSIVKLPLQDIMLVPPDFKPSTFNVDISGSTEVAKEYGFQSFYKDFL